MQIVLPFRCKSRDLRNCHLGKIGNLQATSELMNWAENESVCMHTPVKNKGRRWGWTTPGNRQTACERVQMRSGLWKVWILMRTTRLMELSPLEHIWGWLEHVSAVLHRSYGYCGVIKRNWRRIAFIFDVKNKQRMEKWGLDMLGAIQHPVA